LNLEEEEEEEDYNKNRYLVLVMRRLSNLSNWRGVIVEDIESNWSQLAMI